MRDRGLTDDDLTGEERAWIGADCLSAIDACDVVWWLGGVSGGAHFEAGYAYAILKPIVSSGLQHPVYRCEHFPSDFAALAWIVGNR